MYSVNWFDRATESVRAHHPEASDSCSHVVERLASLLLNRLPADQARALMNLLPDGCIASEKDSLHNSAWSASDRTIGYPEFVQRARHALGSAGAECLRGLDENGLSSLAHAITDTFLWAIVQEVPADLKSTMISSLPLELKSRMNLYTSTSDEARVA